MRKDTSTVDTQQLVALVQTALWNREEQFVVQPDLIRELIRYYEHVREVYREPRWFNLSYVVAVASFFTNFEDALEAFDLEESWNQFKEIDEGTPVAFLEAIREEGDADSVDCVWVESDGQLQIAMWQYPEYES